MLAIPHLRVRCPCGALAGETACPTFMRRFLHSYCIGRS